jgi:hypothetical protein
MDLEKRIRMAAESILENESIREGTDENGAEALLNWGVACAEKIAGGTADIEDNDEAEEATYPRTRALRQMLETVKSLYRPGLEPAEGRAALAEILELAATVYGPEVQLPERLYWNVFASSREDGSGQSITALRALIENKLNPQGE